MHIVPYVSCALFSCLASSTNSSFSSSLQLYVFLRCSLLYVHSIVLILFCLVLFLYHSVRLYSVYLCSYLTILVLCAFSVVVDFFFGVPERCVIIIFVFYFNFHFNINWFRSKSFHFLLNIAITWRLIKNILINVKLSNGQSFYSSLFSVFMLPFIA